MKNGAAAVSVMPGGRENVAGIRGEEPAKQEEKEPFSKKICIDVIDDDSYVHILVADNGTGILLPTEEITEPFVTGKKNGAGMGLGLHIASEVLNAQGGKLSFPEWGEFDLPAEFEQGAKVVLSLKK